MNNADIKRGRRQIIANLKKHYDEMYFEPPHSMGGCDIGVCLPEATLYKYFKELTNNIVREDR